MSQRRKWQRTLAALGGRNASVLSMAIGAFCGLIALMAGLACILAFSLNTTAEMHRNHGRTINQIWHEADSVLTLLNRTHRVDCNLYHMVTLNQLAFGYRYIRDIGLIDDFSRLRCTSSLGALWEPPETSPTDYVLPDGTRLWVDQPVLVGDGQRLAVVIQRGHFNVVLDVHATDEIFQSVDIVWFKLPVGLVPLHIRPEVTDYVAAMANDIEAKPQGFSLHSNLDFNVSHAVDHSGMVLQSHGNLLRTLYDHFDISMAVLLLSITFGALIAAAIKPRFQFLASIGFRIRYLCDASHVVCFYQPIIDLADDTVVGCEVLMRISDGGKMLFPDQTIPAIQQNHLENMLDKIVSEKAIRELSAKLPRFDKFKIAINYFPSNIISDNIDAHLSPILQSTQRSDFQICIEVTEYGFAGDMIEQIQDLEALGYLISVDDFGTGYSNLGVVKRVAPHFLKIDKSFVFEMEDDSIRSTLIPEIVSIGQAVGAQIVAEGIEKENQVARLKGMGVHFGQGYLYARPAPIDEFVQYIMSKKPSA